MMFTEKDFAEWKHFPRRMEREFGETTYTGTDSATMVVNYSSELKAMIRPFPKTKHYEFDLKLLSCRACKRKALWLCLSEQIDYLCDDCQKKKIKNEPAIV